MNVIVRSRGEVVSLLVDDIGDVIDTGRLELGPVPANAAADACRTSSSGCCPLPESILLVLDPDRAADVPLCQETTGGNP